MKTFRRSVIREIRRFGSDRTMLIITVIIPLSLILGYTFMFGRGTIDSLPVGVVDMDRSATSRQLVRMVGSTPSALIAMELESSPQAESALRRGEISAFIIIPDGMEASLLNPTDQAQIGVYINGAYITNSSLLKRDITTAMQAMNIGAETQMLGAKGIPAARGYQMAYPVVMQRHVLFNPFGSYSYYLLPAMLSLVMIIMITMTSIYAIGSEFRHGTASVWIRTAGGSIARALLTKLGPYMVIFMIISVFYTTILYRYMGLPFEAQSVMLLVIAKIFLVLDYMGIAIILIAVTSNMRLSLSLGAAYTIAAFSFAGITFPHMAMYRPIMWLSNLFPYTFYTDLFIEQSIRGAGEARSLGDLAAMGAFILLAAAFIPMLRRKALGGGRYYGKL